MATEVVHIVDPDAGAGYDYDSLYDWEVGEQGNLTVSDTIAIAKCRCTGGTADTTTVVIDGWTTSSTQYIKIWTDPAESYRHNGTRSASKYRMVVTTDQGCIAVYEPYTRVEGVQFKCTYTTCWSAGYSEAEYSVFKDCIFYDSTGQWAYGLATQNASLVYAINCVAMGNAGHGFYVFSSDAAQSLYCYNCVSIANGGGGFLGESATANIIGKNCYAGGNTGSDYSGTMTLTTCRSEDGTQSTTIAAYSTSSGCHFTNVTAGSEDVHIGSSSALIGAATNLYNDANFPFQDDIDGDDRGGSGATWDIGADEYVSAAAIFVPFLWQYRNRRM